MKKTLALLVALAAMLAAGAGLKAQGYTITLYPEWNWISYPYTESVSVENMFEDFEPMLDDMIASFSDYSTYIGEWIGDLDYLEPGLGYMYYSNRTEAVTVSLAMPSTGVSVTTADPTGITLNGFVGGGEVTDTSGVAIVVHGLCWGTEPNPTVSGPHTGDDFGTGSFSCVIDNLEMNTMYYVRAYALTEKGMVYGEEKSFTTLTGGIDHEYVDLGLPSGTLWATCNIGGNAPEDYGDYFAWGETQPKEYYDWSTYQYANGSSLEDPQLTKYCNNADYGYNGFTDNLTTLLPEDDAATANWGENWRTPTGSEYEELFNHTTYTGAVRNGVSGFLFTASNGNSVFLPVTGSISYDNVIYGNTGEYWSSTLLANPNYVSLLFFYSESFGSNIEMANTVRCYGRPVRPVRSAPQSNVPTGAINGKFSINSDGDQVYFSQGNLQYIGSSATPYWKFADNQWDYIGNNGQGGSSQTVDRDLFGWGTSGYNHGANCYQPWSTSETNSDYYAYGQYTYNLFDQSGMADWGYNPIVNGGNQPNQWRTLTEAEWSYIINYRQTSSGVRWVQAKVNNVNGMILLPDDWSNSYYTFNYPNVNSTEWGYNPISETTWSMLEQHGAVFLPNSGSRWSDGEISQGVSLYWSASYYNVNQAFVLRFGNSSMNPSYTHNRFLGGAVRLVHDAE